MNIRTNAEAAEEAEDAARSNDAALTDANPQFAQLAVAVGVVGFDAQQVVGRRLAQHPVESSFTTAEQHAHQCAAGGTGELFEQPTAHRHVAAARDGRRAASSRLGGHRADGPVVEMHRVDRGVGRGRVLSEQLGEVADVRAATGTVGRRDTGTEQHHRLSA